MRSRRPNTLEVHVSFEVNRRARAHLIDAYQLLVPTASKRKPAATEPHPHFTESGTGASAEGERRMKPGEVAFYARVSSERQTTA